MSVAAPVEIEGVKLAETLAPTDAEAMAEAIRSLGARGLAAFVRGAGTELPRGNLPQRADVLLSTLALAGIEELDADEGVARVRAGTPVSELREAAKREGLDVPLDPPSAHSTVGGALATAAIGPRCLGYGRARDAVLGLDVVLGSGERTRCGGRVVKNVTGYDLAKLYVGSLGTLAVITHAWLRLRPLPEEVRVLAAPLPATPNSIGTALDCARLPGVRAAALVSAALASELGGGAPSAEPEGALLVIELASDAPVVSQTVNLLESQHDAVRVIPETIAALAALEGAAEDARLASTVRVRVTARPSRLAVAHAVLRAGTAAVVVHPGLGLLQARFALEPGDGAARIDAVLATIRDAARAGEGSAVVVAAPVSAREGRDVFGDAPAGLALMQRLKAELDPRSVLNPGRFVGGMG